MSIYWRLLELDWRWGELDSLLPQAVLLQLAGMVISNREAGRDTPYWIVIEKKNGTGGGVLSVLA